MPYAEMIKARILELTWIVFDAPAEPGKLCVAAGGLA
jgi:hypothetical protein